MSTTATRLTRCVLITALLAATSAPAMSADSVKIQIKAHEFMPATIKVPASTRARIAVSNENASPAEFEGRDFPTEKVIPGHTQVPVYIGPLDAGTYHFFNEFDPGVTGELIVE